MLFMSSWLLGHARLRTRARRFPPPFHAGDGTGTTADKSYGAVGGGGHNRASGLASTVGGGWMNRATGDYSMVPGGTDNIAAG
ncbi:hypothetical protein HQ563_04385, partial [bacterium]|nr:hypothetical protein [bacterium]